jgi:hypothetical protein
LRAAITDIRRFGKFRANKLFVENTGRGAFATGPAKAIFAGGTFVTNPLSGAFMLKSQEAVIEGFAIGSAFFERDMIFHLFGDSGTILV